MSLIPKTIKQLLDEIDRSDSTNIAVVNLIDDRPMIKLVTAWQSLPGVIFQPNEAEIMAVSQKGFDPNYNAVWKRLWEDVEYEIDELCMATELPEMELLSKFHRARVLKLVFPDQRQPQWVAGAMDVIRTNMMRFGPAQQQESRQELGQAQLRGSDWEN